MLVSGFVDGADNNVIEIIDVEDSSYSCPNSLSFNAVSSSKIYYGGGGMVRNGQNDIPFICGGRDLSKCWQLLAR